MPMTWEQRRARLAQIEVGFTAAEKEVQDAPDDDPAARDITTFPGFSGGVRAASYGGVDPEDLDGGEGSGGAR